MAPVPHVCRVDLLVRPGTIGSDVEHHVNELLVTRSGEGWRFRRMCFWDGTGPVPDFLETMGANIWANW